MRRSEGQSYIHSAHDSVKQYIGKYCQYPVLVLIVIANKQYLFGNLSYCPVWANHTPIPFLSFYAPGCPFTVIGKTHEMRTPRKKHALNQLFHAESFFARGSVVFAYKAFI